MKKSRSLFVGVARAAALGAVALLSSATTIGGCLSRPIEPIEPRITSTIVEKLTQSSVDKIDLVLVIDNSRSMADKQEILNLAVPDLVTQLLNPKCVDEAGEEAATQPEDPNAECPIAGTEREFKPIKNIHIGVLTTSLGGHGADACSASTVPSENDLGQLINRTGTATGAPDVATYTDGANKDLKFLVWDPCAAAGSDCESTHNPPGDTDLTGIGDKLQQMVAGSGEIGCGFEAQLEAWYRFLVEPDPHQTVSIQDDKAVLEGTDSVLLDQRKNFMRPDSLLAIIMLTDENDCSIRDGSTYYFAAQLKIPGSSANYHLPKPRAACASNPNDKCCRSCGQSAGDGCDDSNDGCCANPPDCTQITQLDEAQDQVNLRCFDQKRRFGVDFLQPLDRYTTGLTAATVADRNGNVEENPIYSDLDSTDDNTSVRDSGLVFLAGIVGVPWQAIARRNAAGDPDLLAGLDLKGEEVGGFQNANELQTNGTWDQILGTAGENNAADAHMIESVEPREGLAAPGSGYYADGIHGHEWTVSKNDDLQYACIFPLTESRDCLPASGPKPTSCDCEKPEDENPLCVAPGSSTYGTVQYSAKAYPGLRELGVLKNMGDQGIVGSICPAQQNNPNGQDFGYRPAIGAIVDRLKQALSGQCLPRSLTPNPVVGDLDDDPPLEGQVPCLILEARNAPTCDCDSEPGRQAVQPENEAAVDAALKDPIAANAKWNCFCEITQLKGAELDACQQDVSEAPLVNGEAVDGWCYVDAATSPATGNPEIVADCPPTEQRIIKFAGAGKGNSGATLFITCSGD